MLHLFLEEDKPDDMIEDVEYEFCTFKLDGSDEEELFVNKIEQGHIIRDDYTAFIDRFGFKLPTLYLSTGCKCALCVLHSNKCVSAIECGKNAQVVIVSELRTGSIWVPDYGSGFFAEKDDIDVWLDSYRFTSLTRLNYYLNNERFLNVDLGMEGIVCIN